MKNITRVLCFLSLLLLSTHLTAQTTETFSGGTNGSSFGNPFAATFNTFDFTGTTLSGFNAFFRDDSNGYAQITGSRLNEVTIKLTAGGNFKLDEIVFEVANVNTADDNITVTGYKSSSFVSGATSTFTVPGAIGAETTRDFSSISAFNDIDEIRIAIADDGLFGGIRIESITTDTAGAACSAPTAQATSAIFGSETSSTLNLTSFTAPAGDPVTGYAIYINDTNTFTAPTDGTSPTADTSWNGAGQQAVYFGTSASPNITVSDLDPGTTYYFQIYAYNDCSGTETYETTGLNTNDTTALGVLTITGLTGDNKVYDGTTAATASGTENLSGVASGANDVSLSGTPSYTFASANVGTGITINTSGYTLSGTDAGKYTLTQPTLSGDITAAELTVVGLTGDNKTYDGTTAATASGTETLSGVIGADDVTLGGSGVYTFASANVGTGITINTTGFTISGTDSGNYTLTQPTLSADITAAELTVVGLVGDNKVYDGTTAATASGTETLSGVIGADDVTLGGSGVYTFASANVGTGITINTTGFTISGTDSGNYTLTQPTLSADITAAELTVVGLVGDNKVYDGTTAATASGTETLSGVIGADDVTLGGSGSYTFASANVGTGITINTVGFTISGTDSGNYTLTQPTLSGDITAAELTVVGLTGDDKLFDGTTAATASGTETLSGVIGADDVTLGGSGVFTFASANVGTGITINTTGFTISGTDSGNYTLTQPTLSADITGIALTITGLTGDNKVYDGTTAATASGTESLVGVLGGDDVSISGSPVYTFASANVGTGITINTTGFTLSGADAGKYSLTQPTLSGDITAAELTVVGLTGDNKVYDGTTAATASGTETLSGVFGADDVTLGGSGVYTFASANVGAGITINTTGFTISGTDSGNYTLTQPTLSADITAAELTVVGLTGDNKVYDGTTAATASGTETLSGVIGADDVTLGGSGVYTFASANVGTGITINTVGFTISGTDSGNYTLTQPTLSGDITAAELTVVGLTGDNKVYDGTTAATASGTETLSGVIGADDVTLGGSGVYTFASTNVGTGITINTVGFTISGTDSGNYTLTQPTLSADITAAELTVVGLTGDNKTYDGTTAATASGTETLSGVIGADDVSLGGSGVYTFASANVGTGITINTTGFTISGTDSGNYTLTQPTLSADITGQPLGFASTSDNGVESDSPVTIPVDLSIAHGALTATVDYAVTGGTATGSGTDFMLASGTLTFNPGSTTESISVTISDDMIVETNETIVVTLSNPTNATLGSNSTFTYTINDDDTTTVTMEDISVNEADGTVTLTATLSNAIAEPFFMNITTADVTTSGAADYTVFSDAAVIDFAGSAGETQPVTIPITDDMIGEDVETFTVTFTSVSGTTLGSSIVTGDSATVTINDDDAPQVTAFSPMDDAVDVVVSSDLTITFNQNVVVGTGNILIKNVSDDSTIATIDVTGSEVTVASNVATINPTADLPSETDIYVEVPAGAFENGSGQGNDAIVGNSAWNFTTEDITDPTVVISTTSSGPLNFAFTVTMTFSEPITGFDLTDITVTNGSASIFNQISSTEYTALITPSADGEVTVSILAGALQDTSSNANDNEASNVLSIMYDATNPTLDITSSATDPTNTNPIPVTFTFSEDMDGFEEADLTLTNATIDNFTMVSNSVWTANLIPTADGTVSVELEFDTIGDLAGNSNEAATFSIEFDSTPPTVVVSSTVPDPTNGAFDVTITFSEDVVGLALNVIQFSNGVPSSFVATANEATVTITPVADGPVTVFVPPSAVQDTAGNGNLASNLFEVLYDATRPTVNITSTSPDPTNTTIDVTITFSEDIVEILLNDIQFSNGTPSNFIASDSEATVTVTPIADGPVTVFVPENAVEDFATNGNEASNTLSIEYDATRPTVVLSTTAADPSNVQFDVTATFSEDVTGFEMADLVITNATPSNFSGSGSVYTFTVTPTADGQVTVDVPENVSEDAATNGNEASNTIDILYDATRPVPTITSTVADPTNVGFDITITFTEDVTGFEMADLDITNATPSNFAGSGSVYTVSITPVADGDVTIIVPENVSEDAATNGNEASNEFSVLYDATNPEVLITTNAQDPTNLVSFTATFTFSEDVIGFDASDITTTNAALTDFDDTNAPIYTATITPSADGLVTIDVAAAAAQDAATNTNPAAQFTIESDQTVPTVTVTSSVPDPTNGAFDVTITFSEDVFNFVMADLDVGNGTPSNFAGSGSVYTATITPTADGGVIVFIPAAVAEDAATNPNDFSNELFREFDGTNPTAVISTTAADPINMPFTVDIAFDENVFGFEMADLVVTNGTPSNFTVVTATTEFSVLITPTGAGPVFVDIPAAVAEDLATNPNNAATFEIEYDNIPPLPPNVTHISDYTCSGNVMMTGDNTLEISGTAERESTVEVFLDGISIGTVVTDADTGFWNFDYTGTTLADGTYSFTAQATDIALNTGDLSAPLTITINTVDSDGDGNPDFCDDDDNGNGSTDVEEDCDGDGIVDSQDTDNSACQIPIQQTKSYGFSPNGDGVNDGWVIENITAFPNNVVQVFNRSGKLVFKQNGYQNDWEAISNQLNGNTLGRRLPVGPYIYVIDLGDGSAPVRGWLYINY